MKLAMTMKRPAGLPRKAAAALDNGPLDAALRAAAGEARDEIAGEELDDAIRVEPLDDGSGYAVVMDGADPWIMEFGGRDAPPRPRITGALASAGPRIRRILARLAGGAR